MMKLICRGNRAEDGSITVFMTFVFLLLFALTGTALDSARYFGSGGYVTTSAYGADVAVYGEYNRELFTEYGLFGYGGCNGKGGEDWLERYKEILSDNLRERPVSQEKSILSQRYSSVYQMSAISTQLTEVHYLTEEKYFRKQLHQWITTEGLRDITKSLLGQIRGTDQGQREGLLDDMEQNDRLQKGKQAFDAKQMDQGEEKKESEIGGEDRETDIKKPEKESEGNPLEFIRELMRDGVLSLVCDESSLCERQIETREESVAGKEEQEWTKGKSGTGMLKKFLEQSDSMWNDEMLENQKKKGELIVYTMDKLGSYVSHQGETIPYGLEYLVSGKSNQKDAFASVVGRLFTIRALINFLYVEKDPVLLSQSLETATALAATLMAEAFIPVIQHGILLVLAMEEACVDVTALLQGRRVPTFKDQGSFQMKYAQICTAGKALFRSKAQNYPKAENATRLTDMGSGLAYTQYLWLMLLMNSWEDLYQRTLDVIQFDLRQQFNQTFSIDKCICSTKIEIIYSIPVLLCRLAGGLVSERGNISRNGTIQRRISVMYGYT